MTTHANHIVRAIQTLMLPLALLYSDALAQRFIAVTQ
jgi:hypothetical protein